MTDKPYTVVDWPPGGYAVGQGGANWLPLQHSFADRRDAEIVCEAMNRAFRRGQMERSRQFLNLLEDVL